ncbi:sulfate ABC transporter permease subunit CysT [Chelatococcus sp. SYSU_G07232]|uniref:Sulfate transport system permease protein CysT n=1 Tax=Chelatococcus albus TaxID=3047466 RepID=A0ABT7AJR9_9HYPH|nr:sulfate ABC transporter permease subunit CysT [Chelatococcus sp. SYSU_G07232]MDJ1159630.1 sulfate ABC transporter permease subunit CysT [Chelatococcus sp. SYSU_G07232]
MTAAALRIGLRSRRVLPGFGLTMGTTLTYVALVVLLPLAALLLKSAEIGPDGFLRLVTGERALAAFQVTLTAAAFATAFNAAYGLLMAWVLVRYEFAGKRILDALMDIPFALPTAVAGVALTALYAANGWFGQLFEMAGLKIVYTVTGVALAMAFTSAPFVVRTVQPVLESLQPDIEEASATLGAYPGVIFRRVIYPVIFPAHLTGCALAFARSLGEFGAVIFIAGNLPFKTEIVSLLVFIRLEEYDYAAASAIAVVLLATAFAVLLATNALQALAQRHARKG